jgi:predicted nucleotidyltransferase
VQSSHHQQRDRPDLAGVKPLLERLIAEWKPAQIWLFGSRARGDAVAGSDWDLLVVVPDDCAAELDPVAAWRLARESGVRADVVPCRREDFLEDRNTPNTLAYEAAKWGVLLYER